jgi:enamine deaminase RidA (YjgF/YER057c/UK114 family)
LLAFEIQPDWRDFPTDVFAMDDEPTTSDPKGPHRGDVNGRGGGRAFNPTEHRDQDREMDIQRIGRPDPGAGIPIISYAVIHGEIVSLCGVTANPAGPLGDVKQQTREVLETIDALLRAAGTTKSRLLSAQVWLTDMDDFAAHNDAWNEWVDSEHPPVRACVQAPRLWRPGLLVEIMVTAAR